MKVRTALLTLFLTWAVILSPVIYYNIAAPDKASAAIRSYNSSVRPWRRLAKQYNAAADNFPTADPSPAGTPLALSNAMGKSTGDGSVTVAVTSGFTPPITVDVYYWQYDSITPANSCWIRLAPAATGPFVYRTSIDTTYALFQFALPENTPWLIRSSASVTGNVYTDSPADPNNLNSSAGGTSTF